MADMEVRSQRIRAIAEYGNWHVNLRNITEEEAALIALRPDVEAGSWYNSLNYRLREDYRVNGKTACVCGMEEVLLTKIMAEDLTDYMRELGIRVKYLHSDVDTLERAKIIRDMRMDVFDVLVGINLLREGLDIPEITLVAILDADKEGFLRSETSLIQTVGRAARNVDGHVIMYADTITDSMQRAIDETNRRREIQQKYNEDNGITPATVQKAVRDLISISKAADAVKDDEKDLESMSKKELEKLAAEIEKKMHRAAAELDFETAADLRDRMIEVKKQLQEL